jgi:hypothetical protein
MVGAGARIVAAQNSTGSGTRRNRFSNDRHVVHSGTDIGTFKMLSLLRWLYNIAGPW